MFFGKRVKFVDIIGEFEECAYIVEAYSIVEVQRGCSWGNTDVSKAGH